MENVEFLTGPVAGLLGLALVVGLVYAAWKYIPKVREKAEEAVENVRGDTGL